MRKRLSAEPTVGVKTPLAAAAVSVLVLSTLVALHPRLLYHWDEIQLHLGVEQFDLTWHHPHPPGYYVFVVLARFLGLVLPDVIPPGRWVASVFAAIFVFLLGRRLGVILTLAAASFVICSPTVLYFAVANLTYIPEAALWVALLLGIATRPRGPWLYTLGFAIGLGAGLRQTLLVWGVAVLLLEALRHRDWIKTRDIFPLGLSLAGGIALWFGPMLIETGGWAIYSAAAERQTFVHIWSRSLFVAPLSEVLLARPLIMIAGLLRGIGPAIVLIPLSLWWRFQKPTSLKLRTFDPLLLG